MQRITFRGLTLASDSKYIITRTEGFAAGEGEGQKIRYIDMDGTKTRDFFFEERILTIEGHLLFDSLEERKYLRRSFIRAMNPKLDPAPLIYWDGTERYYMMARGDALPSWGDFMFGAEQFTAYLSVPDYYLLSYEEHNVDIYHRTNLLSSPFTLPCVATERVSEAYVTNRGDVAAECVIDVLCLSDQQSGGGVSVSNETTGECITLSYVMTEGERIEIDMGRCTVTSSKSGNIINAVDSGSDWFLLACGTNHISAHGASGQDISVRVRYRDKYLGV